MLVVSRKLNEKVYIGDNVCVTVVEIDRNKIRLAIEAPRDVAIWRAEIKPEGIPTPPLPLTSRPA